MKSYCVGIVLFVLTSQNTTYSNYKFHEIPKYLSSNLNLVNKDLLIVLGAINKDSDGNNAAEVINAILSKHPVTDLAIGNSETDLKNLPRESYHQLVFCHSVDNGNFPTFRNWAAPFLLLRSHRWIHNILQIGPHLSFSHLSALSKNISTNFVLTRKLRIIFSEFENSSDSLVYETYSINDVRFLDKMSRVVVGSYSYPNGTKYNFKGAVIRATAVDDPVNYPVVTYNQSSSIPQFVRGLGVFDLWDIRDMLNFTVLPIKGDQEISANKSIGIGRQLYEGEADVSILHTYHLQEYVRYLKPLVAMGNDRVYAIFKQPPSFAVRNAFTKPFTKSAWILIASVWGMIIISVFAFFFILYSNRLGKSHSEEYIPYNNHKDSENRNTRKEWDVTETVLWALATFCQRSYFRVPRPISLRFLVINALLWSLVVYSLYSAQIISSFTAEFLPIRVLQDLVDGQFQLLSDPDNFYSDALLPKSASPETREEYRKQLASTHTSDFDSVKQLSLGFKMHFNTLDTLYLYSRQIGISDKETCETFHHIQLGRLSLTSGFFVRKNSPLQEPFNLKLIVIMERGLNGRYMRNYYEETITKCPKTATRYREDLGMADVFSAFLILFGGSFIAFMIMYFEILVWRKCRCKA